MIGHCHLSDFVLRVQKIQTKRTVQVKYPITNYGDPVLRQPFELIEVFDEKLAELVEDMLETMRDAEGIGLAAQQIGKAIALCVVDVPAKHDVDDKENRLNPDIEMPLVLVNPKILETGGAKITHTEGCLSFPDINGKVQRKDEVRITYQDLKGESHEIAACDLVSRCIQHEIDHLNGVLFIDHMSQVKKLALKGKLRRLREDTEYDLEHSKK
jgi:peptide deformylase